MSRKRIWTSVFLLILVTDARSQVFDFFNVPPLIQNYPPPKSTVTTKPRIESIKISSHRQEQTNKKLTTVVYTVDESIENSNTGQNSREKVAKRKNQYPANLFTLTPINLYSTPKPARKTTKRTSQRNTTVNSNKNKLNNQRLQSNYNIDDVPDDNWFDKPIVNNIYTAQDDTLDYNRYDNNQNNDYNNQRTTKRPDYNYGTTKRPYYNYATTKRPDYNYGTTKRNDYTTKNPYATTKNPYYNRPGVKPAVPPVVENLPPITNRPVTRHTTTRPPTRATTKRPQVIVQPRPTDAGAIAFPNEDVEPQIVSGPDEDYMSDAEKRRYIETAERMCDKYKSLTTKQLQAIPLLPSPVAVNLNVSSCAPVNIPLIVGGKVVRIEEFPHMALLGWPKVLEAGYSWKCGGSLISDQFVLTAAHCVYHDRDNTVTIGPPRAVQLGSSYLDDSGALVVRIGSIIRHPKYKSPKSYYDIALVKLVHSVKFSQVIKPACLGVPPPVNQPVIATGWGRTEKSDHSQELRSVSLPIWDMTKCAEALGSSRRLPDGPSSDSQVCAGSVHGQKDTCQGDSGGPAQIQDGCIWRVVAVTSLGRACAAPNTPGVYARVPRAFIASQVFGGRSETTTRQTTTERTHNQNSYGNNQNSYGSNQNNYGSNQNNYGNNQNYGGKQNNYGNNDNYGSNSNYGNQNNYESSNQNYGNNQNYDNNRRQFENDNYYPQNNQRDYRNSNYEPDRTNYESVRREDTTNHRDVNVNAAHASNINNQRYNNDNQRHQDNNERRVYRNENIQNDYNRNSDYSRNSDYNRHSDYSVVNQQNYNAGIDPDSSRIWFT